MKKIKLFTALLMIAMLSIIFSCATMQETPEEKGIEIVNNTLYPIIGVYAMSENQEAYSENLIEGIEIEPESSRTLPMNEGNFTIIATFYVDDEYHDMTETIEFSQGDSYNWTINEITWDNYDPYAYLDDPYAYLDDPYAYLDDPYAYLDDPYAYLDDSL